MSFFYKLQPVSDNINSTDKKTGLVARAVTCGNINLRDIAKDIAARSAFSPGDVLGMLEELVDTTEIYLSRGFSVTLGELGTFSVSATSRIVQDEKEIRGQSVKMKRLVHRPTPAMTKRLKTVDFVRIADYNLIK